MEQHVGIVEQHVGIVEQHVGIVEQQKHGDKVGMVASNSSVYTE